MQKVFARNIGVAIVTTCLMFGATAHPEPLDVGQKYGGMLVITNTNEFSTFNSNAVVDFSSYFVNHAGVFSRLVALNRGTGNVLPDLAMAWDVSADATVLTFELHPDAMWHDGVPVTSADVEWTLSKIISEQSWQSRYLNVIDAIETPDDHTVILRLARPNAALLTNLGELNGPIILPRHVYEGTDWTTNPANEAPIGSGPFKFTRWVKGSHVELEANTQYHWGRPYVDRLIVRFILSQAVDTAAMETGQTQYMSQSPAFGELDRLSRNQNLTITLENRMLPIWMAFNLEREPFDDLRVRQALAMAIDKRDIARRVYYGTAPVARTTYLSSSWAHNPDALEPVYDLAEAGRLLDEAGLTPDANGVRLTVRVADSITLGFAETNQVLREQWARIGVRVVIESMDWGSFTEKVLQTKDFDVALVGGPHGPDPDAFSDYLETDRLRNSMGYSNPRVDELFEIGRSTGDLDRRREVYFEIQEIIAQDLPRVNIVEYVWPVVFRSDWHGFPPDPAYQGLIPDYDMSHVWWEGATGSTLD